MLASLYTGFNGNNLTQERLSEINERLAKFPASSLSTKLKNPSLNKLRQKLSELGMHKQFMSVLSRKYRLRDPNFSTTETDETENLVSKRLPETYGAKNEIFDQILPDNVTAPHQVENVQAQKKT